MSALEALPAEAPQEAGTELVLVTAPARTAGEKDYLTAAVWSGVAATAAWLTALPFAAPSLLPAILVAAGGLGFLGYLDSVTLKVKDRHNLIYGTAVLLVLAGTQGAFGTPVLMPALIGAVSVFAAMYVLAHMVGIGGGDIKLAPIPAAVLAAYSSAGVIIWLFLFFALLLVHNTAAKARRRTPGPVAGVPLLAGAFLLTIAAVGLLGVAGL